MKNFSLLLSTVAVILAAIALFKTSQAPVATSAAGNADSVASALAENPKMVVDALQQFQIQQREAEERAAQEALAKFADQINSDAGAPSIGPKDAKVTVVEFFDFSCGYCKRLAPELAKVVADNADVKFVFKPLSFLAPISAYQAKGALAAHKQGKFVEFYKGIMTSPARLDEAKTDELAASLGIDVEQYKKDMAGEEIAKNLADIAQLAENIQVHGVPTVIINGKQIQAMSYSELQNAINAAK